MIARARAALFPYGGGRGVPARHQCWWPCRDDGGSQERLRALRLQGREDHRDQRGDVAFSATMAEAAVVKKAEAALKKRLGRKTPVRVRSRDGLRKMVQNPLLPNGGSIRAVLRMSIVD